MGLDYPCICIQADIKLFIMRTFSINTLGCKVNQYESQQIRQFLEQLGLAQAEISDKPDLIVVNTCCVTGAASAKSRQYIHKAQRINPDAVTIVCGCLPTAQIGELNGINENVHIVRHRDSLAAVLTSMANGDAVSSNGCNINSKNDLPQLTSFKGQTRAFLKVQDGCDGFCSYCIVPRVRPFVQSKPAQAALQEAQALVEAGHREIVITGVFLGAYGRNSVRRKTWANQQNDKIADLLDRMAQIQNLARIRLSSLEPADVTPLLLDVFCRHRNIMPHLHLSLQSGSNAVLKRMCRQYTAGEFREKVELVQSRLDKPAITTDIIVGFPGETDADFQQTIALAKEVGFAKMHIFSFSPRKDTAAAFMQGAVDNRVIKERSLTLRDLEAQLGRAYRQQFVGETAEILVENSDEQVCGRSERYFMVCLKETGEEPARNEIVRVKLVENGENGMIGAIQKYKGAT